MYLSLVMPSEEDHKLEAQKNEVFSKSIESELSSGGSCGKVNNWIIIAEFYRAVHYVDAVLSRSSYHPKKHGDRFSYIESRRDFSNKAETVYETIYDLSQQARYNCVKMNKGQVNSARKCIKILENELDNIP